MTEEAMALCRAMGAGEDQEALLRPLVQAAEAAWRARLRRSVAPEECGKAFVLAVAMTAMDGLDEAFGAERVAAFTAGQVSIRTAERRKELSRLAQAERLMAPWLGETGFAFRGVNG